MMTIRETISAGTTLLSAAASLPFPPLAGGDVADWMSGNKAPPEFDLELSSDNTSALTNLELDAAVAEAQSISDDDFTATNGTNTLTATTHGLQTGDGPIQLTNAGGALPAGLETATDYWVIKSDANDFQLALTRADALADTAVAFTDDGTGTHTLEDTATTERLQWASHGLLGQAEDGAINLTATKRFTQRCRHRIRVVAYSVSGAVDAGNITVKAFPVTEV
jgi:hypothetical protein